MQVKVADWYARGLSCEAPKVSVATTTYRHEDFIGEAIDSVLAQEVDFPVEMVIGEDCSPDGTRAVIQSYIDKYPGFIRLSNYRKNIGSAMNCVRTIGRCRGVYVAMLDGDDYWTSPYKLRRQVDLLDRRPELSLCFHAVNRVRDGRIVKSAVYPTGRRSVYQLADLAQWINISTSSMLFRRSALPVFPAWYTKVSQGDWAIQLLLAERGDIGYLTDVMGTHRLHANNIWAGRARPKSRVLLEKIEEVDHFREHLGPDRARPFELSQFRRYYELVHAWLDEGEEGRAREILRACHRGRGYDPRIDVLEPWLSLLHLKAPRLYRHLHVDAVYLNRLLHRSWGRLVRPLLDRMSVLTAEARKK